MVHLAPWGQQEKGGHKAKGESQGIQEEMVPLGPLDQEESKETEGNLVLEENLEIRDH